jgi:hypothetical protein
MRLITIHKNMTYGTSPDNAWLILGTFANNGGWIFFFHLPLFCLRWNIDIYNAQRRYGWHVPLIGFRKDQSGPCLKIYLDWAFHSSFMGEETVEEY